MRRVYPMDNESIHVLTMLANYPKIMMGADRAGTSQIASCQ